MIPYPAYKSTNLPWLPKIPEHWGIVRCKQIFRPIDVRSEKGEEQLLSVSERYGVVKREQANVTMFKAASYEGYKLCWPDDLAINSLWAWSYGLGFSPYHGIISTAYSVFRLKDKTKCLPRFYDYLVRSKDFHWELRVRSKGLWKSRYQLSDDAFLAAPILDVPIAEQEQIVRYLDSMTAKINKLIRAKKKQIALLQEQRQAIINRAVTRGLDPNAEMKDSGIDWIGEIPKDWRMPHLSFLTTKIGSGKTPRGGAEIYQESGVRFIRSQNVYFNRLVTDNLQYISESIDATMPSTRVLKDDVLLNITGASIGRCCVYRSGLKANVNQHVCIIRCRKDLILPDYLASVLFSRVGQEAISHCQNEGNRESLTFPQIGAFFIPLPSIEEQQQILGFVAGRVKPIEDVVNNINKEIDTLNEYRNSLISSVVTGQTDVRNIPVEDVIPDDLIPEDVPTSEIENEPITESEE